MGETQPQAKGQIKIPVKVWRMGERVACTIMRVLTEYSDLEMSISRDIVNAEIKERFKRIVGSGASIKMNDVTPVEPVHKFLNKHGFYLINNAFNSLVDFAEYKEEWVSEQWEKEVYRREGKRTKTVITVQVDLDYVKNNKGVTNLKSVSIYPIMRVWKVGGES